MEVSVIICTHNPPAHFLRRVLESLRNQTLPVGQWELLVIDNASQELLTAETCDLSWHPRARIVREEELGLSAARMRGMREATTALLVFVDDDNVLAPDYLAEALKIGREWPQLGVWGGSIVPEFEVEPPEHLKEFTGCLALREIKTPRWSNVMTCSDAEPWGAGLCARATVAAEYRLINERSSIQLADRISGKSLVSGGDTEICFTACTLGLGMGLFPNLQVTHLIPRERINENYLVQICEGIQISVFLVGYKWRGVFPDSPFSGAGWLRIIKNLFIKRGMQRRMYLAELRAAAQARRIIEANSQK